PLLVECVGGGRRAFDFVIDSGCSVTTMDLARARSEGIPTTGRRVPRSRTGSTGTRTVVEGTFRFWLSPDRKAAPFVAPIHFEETHPAGVRRLFGPEGHHRPAAVGDRPLQARSHRRPGALRPVGRPPRRSALPHLTADAISPPSA